MAFIIKIDLAAKDDIQEGINWYNQQQLGLGRKFHNEVKKTFAKLMTNPFFQVRYDEVRCLPLKKHPYLIHFTVNENDKIIIIRAVLNTARNPEIWGTDLNKTTPPAIPARRTAAVIM